MPTWSELLDHANAAFDKTPTPPIIGFEILVILGTVVALVILANYKDRILRRFWIMALGVLIFEVFTGPMWNNYKMGIWAYLYRDVAWVLTLGWSTMILSTIVLVDIALSRAKEWQRFVAYLAVMTCLVVVFERIVVELGIRSYSPEVMEVIEGSYIPVLDVPYHLFYYVPIFLSLVIGFYKYWNIVIDQEVPISVPRPWMWALAATIVGVFFFEVMIEPMVVNSKLPSWSYVYRDISFLMTGGWVALIWLAMLLVDRFLPQWGPRRRFIGYLVVLAVIPLLIEAWLINSGVRVYVSSATEDFTGFRVPLIDVPFEIAFAIPLYMALIIGFVRYWERVAQEAILMRRER